MPLHLHLSWYLELCRVKGCHGWQCACAITQEVVVISAVEEILRDLLKFRNASIILLLKDHDVVALLLHGIYLVFVPPAYGALLVMVQVVGDFLALVGTVTAELA